MMNSQQRSQLLKRAALAIIVALSEGGYPDATWVDAESELSHADDEHRDDYNELLAWANELESE